MQSDSKTEDLLMKAFVSRRQNDQTEKLVATYFMKAEHLNMHLRETILIRDTKKKRGCKEKIKVTTEAELKINQIYNEQTWVMDRYQPCLNQTTVTFCFLYQKAL